MSATVRIQRNVGTNVEAVCGLEAGEEARRCSSINQALFPTIAFPRNMCAAEIESAFLLL